MCKAAPIPGETRTWKYITLFKRIFLIDSPGVVYGNLELSSSSSSSSASGPVDSSLRALESETTSVLKGVVRIDNLDDPSQYVTGVLARVKREYVVRTYGVAAWEDTTDFLEQYARMTGKLLKGGEYDLNAVARMVLNDWQRGRIPYFVCPPFEAEVKRREDEDEVERRKKEEERRMKVEQMYSNIQLRVKFDEEDTRGPSALTAAEVDEERADGQAVKDWDRVYEKVTGEEVESDAEDAGPNDESKEAEEGGDDEVEELGVKEAADDEEDLTGEVSEEVVRAPAERRAQYHRDADDDGEDDEVEVDTKPFSAAAGSAAASPQLFMRSRQGGAGEASQGPSAAAAKADGDTRPRSKKNKSRSKKNRKELSKKRKFGWK